jgi:hypothetical protein
MVVGSVTLITIGLIGCAFACCVRVGQREAVHLRRGCHWWWHCVTGLCRAQAHVPRECEVTATSYCAAFTHSYRQHVRAALTVAAAQQPLDAEHHLLNTTHRISAAPRSAFSAAQHAQTATFLSGVGSPWQAVPSVVAGVQPPSEAGSSAPLASTTCIKPGNLSHNRPCIPQASPRREMLYTHH